MTDAALRQALAFATRGWPVLPCQPGQKTPATRRLLGGGVAGQRAEFE